MLIVLRRLPEPPGFFLIWEGQYLFPWHRVITQAFCIIEHFYRMFVRPKPQGFRIAFFHLPVRIILLLWHVKRDGFLVINRGAAFEENDALRPGHPFDFRRRHQLPPSPVEIHPGIPIPSPVQGIIAGINCRLPQRLGNIFMRPFCQRPTPQIYYRCHVVHDRFPFVVLIKGLYLSDGLEDWDHGDVPAPDHPQQHVRFLRLCPRIKLVHPDLHAAGQGRMQLIIRQTYQDIEHLCIKHGNQEIVRTIVVRNY